KVKRKGPKKVDTDTVTVEAKIKDNFDEIDLYVNGNHVYFHELSSPYGMHGFDETIKLDLDLEDGENTFVFEVVDLGGHVTTEEIKIVIRDKWNGKEKGVEPQAGKPDTPTNDMKA